MGDTWRVPGRYLDHLLRSQDSHNTWGKARSIAVCLSNAMELLVMTGMVQAAAEPTPHGMPTRPLSNW